jgi:hypothetical protein
MAYLDLILRSVTEPGLLRIFVKFLLDADKFDGQRIIDVLIERINSVDSRVSGKRFAVCVCATFRNFITILFVSALYGDTGPVRHIVSFKL